MPRSNGNPDRIAVLAERGSATDGGTEHVE